MDNSNKHISPGISEEQLAKIWETLPPSNSVIFSLLMRHERAFKALVEPLLGIKVSHLEYLNYEETMLPSDYSHGVRYDVYAEADGKMFDIEMQVVESPDIAKRARYYEAVMDTDSFQKGTNYRSLKDSVVIFLCPFDATGSGQTIAEYRMTNTQIPCNVLNDGRVIYFINFAEWKKCNIIKLKGLLEFFRTGKSSDKGVEFMQPLLNQVRGQEPWRIHNVDHRELLAKTREEGRQEGREEGLEEGLSKGLEEGLSRGREKGIVETAARLLRIGVSPEIVSNGTGLALEKVLKLKDRL